MTYLQGERIYSRVEEEDEEEDEEEEEDEDEDEEDKAEEEEVEQQEEEEVEVEKEEEVEEEEEEEQQEMWRSRRRSAGRISNVGRLFVLKIPMPGCRAPGAPCPRRCTSRGTPAAGSCPSSRHYST